MEAEIILKIALYMAIAYMLGSISFAVIISRMRGADIRQVGSKNAGSTNMLRTFGAKWAALTFAGDFLKGAFAVWLTKSAFAQSPWAAIACGMAGMAAIFGHMKPIFFQFKGGKGVATVLGVLAMFHTTAFFIVTIPGVTLAAVTGYVSFGAVTGAFLYPIAVYLLSVWGGHSLSSGEFLVSLAMACLIIFNHRENIKNLIKGTERNIWKKDK